MTDIFTTKWLILPITLIVIGYFGIFWTMNISNISINMNMDDNTLEAIKTTVDASVKSTCEQGCYYVADNWFGISEENEKKMIKECILYCAENEYENRKKVNDNILTIVDNEVTQ